MRTKNITASEFRDEVDREGIVLLDWWAAWCGPCRAFAPIYEAAALQHPDVTFGKVDVDRERALASAFQIRSVPMLMAFRDGILLFSQAGVLPARALDELIGKLRALDMAAVRRQVAEHAAGPGDRVSDVPQG